MKTLVALLALAMAAGAQAIIPDVKSDSRLNKLVQDVKQHEQNISFALTDLLIEVSRTEFGREFGEMIGSITSKLSHRADKFQQELSSEAVDIYGLIVQVARGVLRKGENLLSGVRRKVRPETLKLYESLQSYAEPFLERVEPFTKPLFNVLPTMTELADTKLDKKLPAWLESFRPQLSPYINDLKKIHESLESVANQFQEVVIQRMEVFSRQLWSHFGHILMELQNHREEFGEWVDRPVFPPDQ